MTFLTRSFRALLWRNYVYRKRRLTLSLIEFFLPALCVATLYFIKVDIQSDPNSSLKSYDVPPYYPVSADTIIPFSFQDYVTALQAKRVCIPDPNPTLFFVNLVISGINHQDWPVPFVFCNSYQCETKDEDATKYCTYKTLALAPMNNTQSTSGKTASSYNRMMSFKSYVEEKYPQITDKSALPFDYDFIQIFESNDDLQSYVSSQNYGGWENGEYMPKVGIAIVFGDGDDKFYDYTIRVNSTNFNSPEQAARPVAETTPPTDRIFDPYTRQDSQSCFVPGQPSMGKYGSSCTGQYLLNGALTLERLVNDWIIEDSGASTFTKVAQNSAVFLPFPTKGYTQSGFYENIAPFAPLLFTLGLLYPISSTIRGIVLEKETRQKELMKMMSVTECDIGWSWFISLFSFFCPSGALTAVFTNLLYSNSDYAWLLLFWELTFVACIVFCFLISSFSTKATRATLIGIMTFFVGYFLPFVVDYQEGNPTLIAFVSLHPVTAYTYGLILMGYLEGSGVGVRSTTVASSEFPSGYTFIASLSMLLFDCILWGVVSWYLNRILKGDYGTALSWYFPFTRQYWFPRKHFNEDLARHDNQGSIPIESISDTMKKQHSKDNSSSVHIHNLRKQFGEKAAVDGLNLSMYSGQITALLGHNGAGKTTTIGMLTGFVTPTSGFATVAGYDIRSDLPLLRENIGVCLQHDCLFPQMTVKEHVEFFCRVKGLHDKKSKKEVEKCVMSAIEDVDLAEKKHTYSKDLSGGMKRKLSVAIAFCGDSKVVFLDEPTSGMDPFSRRFTWNVIRQYRENRCIVLTTHFMDEADLLGDRIAIMADGRLRCAGSSLFLKKKYGVGYILTIIKENQYMNKSQTGLQSSTLGTEDANEIVMSNSTQDLDSALIEIVKSSVPESTTLSNVGTEISFQLPIGASSNFIGIFEELDCKVKERKIESYGVSITTLDEVFLMVARGEEGMQQPSASNSQSLMDKGDMEDESISFRPSSETLNNAFKRHVQALFVKRAKNFKRDKKAWCCSVILPTITSLFGFLIVKFITSRRQGFPPLTLTLDQNNPEVSIDRNPIPFNSPGGSYECQPGNCMYEWSDVNVVSTNETYYFCGSNAKIKSVNGTVPYCSISESSELIGEISEFGSFGVENDVSGVFTSSKSVYSSASFFEASQYGSIFFTHDSLSVVVSNESTYDEMITQSCMDNLGDYSTLEQCANYEGVGYIVNYNFTSLHSSLLYQAVADEAIIRHSLNDPNYKISVSIWPLPITEVESGYVVAGDSFSAWFLIVLSFPFIAGAFATFVVAERESKARHLQTVAGVKPFAYWLSTYLWDVLNYQIPLWTIITLMYLLDIEAFTKTAKSVSSGTISLLILFGPAAAGFTYIVSFWFRSPSMSNLFVIVFNFFVGMAGPILVLIFRLLAVDPANPKQSLKTAAVVLEWVLRLIPSFCLGKGLLYIINIDFFEFVEGQSLTAWSPEIALLEVIFLGIETVVFILIAIEIDILSSNPRAVTIYRRVLDFITLRYLCKTDSKPMNHVLDNTEDDEDVSNENERVQSGSADNDLIILKEITKQYPNGKLAVDHMSLGIPPGQCFGLLGINGAGKTTTMAMLTAEFPPTSGDATLAGFSVCNEPERTRQTIGYCPQFDAHFMNMTGREHIELYAIIKGVPREVLKEAVAAKLNEVGLSEFDGNRLSSGYSGGMKRKLSVACATIGQPQIVFLDEPSTGMDPVARRDLWKVISRMVQRKKNNASVILTTHSMEECEALCPRIGIMAGGKLRCLGSAQHLKNRFGSGYQIEMKVKHAVHGDPDVQLTAKRVLNDLGVPMNQNDFDDTVLYGFASETFLTLDQVMDVCVRLADDDYLKKMIVADNPNGYHIFKSAESNGVSADDLVGFCVEELRMRSLVTFIQKSYPSSILRERQDTKVRFEIASEGITIASIFSNIEQNKDELMLDDYGVSQTSLEQVFNMHAAAAEKAKQNTIDF